MAPPISRSDIESVPSGFVPAEGLDALRAQGWQVEPSGMSLTFRESWTMWHALREFGQNSLDAAGSFDLIVDHTPGKLPLTVLSDEGAGIPVGGVRLGQRKGGAVQVDPGQQAREQHCLRGRFGEGMKLGVLPVLRAGGRVFIRTKGFDFAFVDSEFMLLDERSREVMLCLRRNSVTQGTTVAIEGLDARNWTDDKGNNFDLSMRFLPALAAAKPDLILATSKGNPDYEEYAECKVRQMLRLPGALYVRDVFVQGKPDMVLGWNLWFDDSVAALDPNRDTLKLDSYDSALRREMSRVLAGMPTEALVDLFRRMLLAPNGPNECWEFRVLEDAGWMMKQHIDLEASKRIHAAVVEVAGKKDISWANIDKERKILEHASVFNMEKLLPLGIGELLMEHGLIKKPSDYNIRTDEAERVLVTPKEFEQFVKKVVIPDSQKDARPVSLAFRQVHARFQILAKQLLSGWSVPVHFYLGKGDDNDRRYGGFAVYEEGEHGAIYIKLTQIAAMDAVTTLIHECAHIRRQNTDLTDEFEQDLARIGERLAQYVARHPSWFQSLRKALDVMTDTEFKVGAYKVTGKGTVSKEEQGSEFEYDNVVLDLINTDGFQFFTGRLPPNEE